MGFARMVRGVLLCLEGVGLRLKSQVAGARDFVGAGLAIAWVVGRSPQVRRVMRAR
jgi:hypothetical protein